MTDWTKFCNVLIDSIKRMHRPSKADAFV